MRFESHQPSQNWLRSELCPILFEAFGQIQADLMSDPVHEQSRGRVVVAGLGDTGLLVAMELAKSFDVIGVSPKPALVSGQELGLRLAAPERWRSHYLRSFDRFLGLDGVQQMQAKLEGIDPAQKQVRVVHIDGQTELLGYDALVIASGVTNGFWREPSFQDTCSIHAQLQEEHEKVAQAKCVAVIGGGVSGVASAANIARAWPDKVVHLYFSADKPLPGYHERSRREVCRRLEQAGVRLYPNHRALIPEGFDLQSMTSAPVQWSTGQRATQADLVLWTVGKVVPNSHFVPASMKTQQGFVKVDAHLQVPGHPGVFAVGDIADSDPLRCSARNWGHRIVAHNVRVLLQGHTGKMKAFEPSPHRWGSIFGVQPDGLEVFSASGRRFRVPKWFVETVLFPVFVDRMIYRGLRKPQ